MKFEIGKYHDIASDALALRSTRQNIIASNIANIDTPFYKAKDIRFEDILAQKADEIDGNTNKSTLQLAKTHSNHLSPNQNQNTDMSGEVFFRPNHASRNDANSVDLDIETTEMSKNSIMVNAISTALKKKSNMFKMMIDISSKVQ
jgi:flagellar basal-body rod protein FlgB